MKNSEFKEACKPVGDIKEMPEWVNKRDHVLGTTMEMIQDLLDDKASYTRKETDFHILLNIYAALTR